MLAAARDAARALADRLRDSQHLRLLLEPELDIVAYLPRRTRLSEIDVASAAILRAGMEDADPLFLSTLQVAADDLTALHPELEPDAPAARVLRSVLMKPEHAATPGWLATRLEQLARATR